MTHPAELTEATMLHPTLPPTGETRETDAETDNFTETDPVNQRELNRWLVIMVGGFILVALTIAGVRQLWLMISMAVLLVWLTLRIGGRP